MLDGTAGHSGGGIKCGCCSEVLPVSKFQAHAGHGASRPFERIRTKAGRSLKELFEEQCQGGGGGAATPRCDAAGDAYCCIICHKEDFLKTSDGFGDRTIIICDQCDREFHVGCAREAGVTDLKARSGGGGGGGLGARAGRSRAGKGGGEEAAA